MDAHDLFKKLSAGSKFNTKRFRSDAERFQLVRKDGDAPVGSANKRIKWLYTDIGVKSLEAKQPNDSMENTNSEMDTLTVLDGFSIPMDGSKVKNNKHKTILTEDKKLKQDKEKINQCRNVHHISVTGNQVPKPITTFEELSVNYGVSESIVKNLDRSGYSEPTPIQMQAMPVMLEGKQLLACAPTGSGKTAAFLIPILHHLSGPQKKGFRAIVLSPTRELAKQTYRECIRLSEGSGFRVHIINNVKLAATKYGPQSSKKFDILITTPRRLVYLLNQDPPSISFENVEWLIVDESDKLFEDGTRGFKKQLEEISTACTHRNLHRALFSATNTPTVTKWCRRNLKGLVTVTVGRRNAVTDLVDQELLFVGNESGKLLAFRNIIQKGISPPVLVFVQSKERAEELFNELIYDGINVDVIHSDRTQTQRDNVVRCFREGKIWVLICTELMGRGIDFKGVNLVVNYDFPPTAISYIHRIGRTGRAGHKGKAITFFTQQDTTNLRSIAALMRASNCEVPDYMLAMKKRSKKEKRKLQRTPQIRDPILTEPKYRRLHRKNKERENGAKQRNNEDIRNKVGETLYSNKVKRKLQESTNTRLNKRPGPLPTEIVKRSRKSVENDKSNV